MMKEQNQVIQWIKDHKKQLILAGVSIATLIALVLVVKNKDALKALWASLKNAAEPAAGKVANTVSVTVEDTQSIVPNILHSNDPSLPFEVRRHIRNLPEGWHASLEKRLAALSNNIILEDGQTWVEAYTKGASAVA